MPVLLGCPGNVECVLFGALTGCGSQQSTFSVLRSFKMRLRAPLIALAALLALVSCKQQQEQKQKQKQLTAQFNDFHESISSPLSCLNVQGGSVVSGNQRAELSCASTVFGRHAAAEEGDYGGKHCDMIRDHVFFHAIFDFQRPSSTPLFLNHICRALALCIPASHFRILLHVNTRASKGQVPVCGPDYAAAVMLLQRLKIPYTTWTGEFDTISSQRARLVALRDLQESATSNWILQVDADEMPVFGSASAGLSDLFQKLQASARNCDVVYGHLSERVSRDGKFINISLATPLDAQFPLICNVKEKVERAQSRKLVLYRASYRAGIGNHRLICEQKSGKDYAAQMGGCAKIFAKRADLRSFHPPVAKLPQMCDFSRDKIPLLDIEHYKYTWGLQQYLRERIDVFKKNKIAWHSESTAVLNHIKDHGGGLCVTCKEIACRNVSSRL